MSESLHHLVLGAGPVGRGTALALAARGDRVTVVTRSGSGPEHLAIARQRADAADAEALTRLAGRAATIVNCVNPPYHRWPTDWPPVHRALMTTAERTGAVLVMMDNLYAFGPGRPMPMHELDPLLATGRKGAMRARMASELLAAHAAGRLRATLARASDFYGPTVRDSVLGARVVPRLLDHKRVTMLGSLDVPHSFSYMPDVIRTLVTIATDERAWGRPWHVPNAAAVSQRVAVETLAAAAGTGARMSALPKAALIAVAPFVPLLRELKETWYQFAEPFVTDSTLTEATFGLHATPFEDGAEATIAWWRAGADGPVTVDV
jgi:nucleoside-diphosphate-sugar epimerase